ncbi:MAG: hypothetical protein SYR96_32020 [Actinomycetota bacterium]|nr:hypothetical protein [Actinomycetota bacterium]
MDLTKGWGLNAATEARLRLLEKVYDAAGGTPYAPAFSKEVYAGPYFDLQYLRNERLIELRAISNLVPYYVITGDGASRVEWVRQRRTSAASRSVACRDSLLEWTYNWRDWRFFSLHEFSSSDFGRFLGSTFEANEVVDSLAWLDRHGLAEVRMNPAAGTAYPASSHAILFEREGLFVISPPIVGPFTERPSPRQFGRTTSEDMIFEKPALLRSDPRSQHSIRAAVRATDKGRTAVEGGHLSQETETAGPGGNFSYFHTEVQTIMSDTYNVGQAGAVGRGAEARDFELKQEWQNGSAGIDINSLVNELAQLRLHLRDHAQTPEQDESVAAVNRAQDSAAKGDGPGTLQHLRRAGKWALTGATTIGTGVAAAAIKSAMGL